MRGIPRLRQAVPGLASLLLVTSLQAEPLPAGCAALSAFLTEFTMYEPEAALSVEADGACVIQHAGLVGQIAGQPGLKADLLRLSGMVEAGHPVELVLEATGLRLDTGLGSTALDEDLRSFFRFQRADLRLALRLDPSAQLVKIAIDMNQSGGSSLAFSGEVAAASLSPLGLATGRLAAIDLEISNDPRLTRLIMEKLGAELVKDAPGQDPIDLARKALEASVAGLPDGLVDTDGRVALGQFVQALPSGRGQLGLAFESRDGLGLAELVALGRSDGPPFAERLPMLLADATLVASWKPGLQP